MPLNQWPGGRFPVWERPPGRFLFGRAWRSSVDGVRQKDYNKEKDRKLVFGMIVTLTMNPAVDKTARLERLIPHGLNRLPEVLWDIGGKGINVSRTVAALGGTSIACGLVAGQTGAGICKALEALPGVEPDFLTLARGETRTNLKIMEADGALTELNEAGPQVSPEELEELTQKLLRHAGPDTLFVLAGSVGPGVPADFYAGLIRQLHSCGARVFADADGALLAQAIQAGPDIIKPNAFELSQYFGLDHIATDAELVELGHTLVEQGIGAVCISMGGDGACLVTGQGAWRSPALPVAVASSVGAGDAMVGAISYALDGGQTMEEGFRLAMAASSAAVTTPGTKPPARETVDRLLPQVELYAVK